MSADILQRPIDALTLDRRSQLCLADEGIVRISDLVERTPVELLRIPNFGRRTLMNVEKALKSHGLQLRGGPHCWPEVQPRVVRPRAEPKHLPALRPTRASMPHCSFCYRCQDEVKNLISAPLACICDDCVRMCDKILSDHARSNYPPDAAKALQVLGEHPLADGEPPYAA